MLNEVVSERTEHRRLLDLRKTAGVLRTQIQNFAHYKDPTSGLWMPTEDDVSSGLHDLDGDSFQFRKRGRLTFYAGDTGALSNKTGVAIQMTHAPSKWIKMRLRGAANVPWIQQDGRTIRFDNVFAGTDAKLFWRAARRRIEKVIAITSLANLPDYFEIDCQMPDAATVVRVSNGWLITHGDDAYLIGDAFGWSAPAITTVPNILDGQIDCTTTLEIENRPGDGYLYLRFRVRPDAAAVSAAVGAGYRVMIDPPATTVISGTTDLIDNTLRESFTSQNRGAFVSLICGTSGTISDWFIVFRVNEAAIPSGTVSAVRWIMSQNDNVDQDSAANFDIHRIIVSWGELVSTWNDRDNSIPTPWNTAGCLGAGTDYNTTTLMSDTFPSQRSGGPNLRTYAFNAAGIAQFENWRDVVDPNHGWVVHTDTGILNSSAFFDSTEGTIPPTVEVDTPDVVLGQKFFMAPF